MDKDKSIEPQDWLNERIRPGNWLDIASDEEIPEEVTGWMRTLVHMHQICFSPEIRRRIEDGRLPNDFYLWAAQLIQPHSGDQILRLNDEVRGVSYLRTGRPIQKGDQIELGDLEHLEVFDLHDDELDCGHFTVFWTGSSWVGAFDFRAGRAKCLALLEKAKSFVSAARLASEKGLAEPALDTLHTASELTAKARLILSHHPAHEWKTHAKVSSAINREGQMGNVDTQFLALFNRLGDDRNHAKYSTGYDATMPTVDEIDLVEAMALGLLESAKSKAPPRDAN